MARHMRNGRDYSRPGPKVDYELRKDSNNAARSGDVYNKIEEIRNQIVPTASIESGETASKAYSKGDFLVKNGVLYKVTNAITEGDTLTVGTNIDSTTVVDELSERSSLTDNKLDDESYVGSNAEDYFRLVKIGNIVFVNFRKMESTSSKGQITIKKLPIELIPKNEQRFSFVVNDSSATPDGIVKNDGYLYSNTVTSRTVISSEFFYFLD